MGLATIDPLCHKMQTKPYKIPKFGVNRPKIKVSKIQPFENVKICREMYRHRDAVLHSVRMAIHFFVNFDDFKSRISVKTSLINNQLGDFVNPVVFFLIMWINSC